MTAFLKDIKDTLQQFKPPSPPPPPPVDAFLFSAQPSKKPGNKVAQISTNFFIHFL